MRRRLVILIEREDGVSGWNISCGPRESVSEQQAKIVHGKGSVAFAAATAMMRRQFIHVFGPKGDRKP